MIESASLEMALSSMNSREIAFAFLWIVLMSLFLLALVTGAYRKSTKNVRFTLAFVVTLYTIVMLVYTSQVDPSIGHLVFGVVAAIGLSAVAAKLLS